MSNLKLGPKNAVRLSGLLFSSYFLIDESYFRGAYMSDLKLLPTHKPVKNYCTALDAFEMHNSSTPHVGRGDRVSGRGGRNSEQDLLYRNHAANRNLYYDGKRLPYNPDLVDRARELRKSPTKEERRIWKYIRTLPVHAYRQRVIDNYIVDLYFPIRQLVVEIDGGQHCSDSGKHYDDERTRILNELGLKVIRFTNLDVKTNADNVCMQIWRELRL